MHAIVQTKADTRPKMSVAHVSTFPPLRCGIASFVSDLIHVTPGFDHQQYRLNYGCEPPGQDLEYADINSESDLAKLGRSISASRCEIVCLQHEFGIWGGCDGENIHAFLDNLNKPVLSVLHTTFAPGVRSRVQADIIVRLIAQSVRVIVLTTASKAAAEALYGSSVQKIVVVPHGVPDAPYVPPPEWPLMKGHKLVSPIRLITPGFLRPDKGFEMMLFALRELRDRGYEISYRIAGEPQQQFPDQCSYCVEIERLISKLELDFAVQIDRRYLSVEEQIASVQGSHLGVFPYQVSSWASSGTVPLVMCMGRPVVCTPFEYARVKAKEGRGVFLTPGFDSAAIASGIEEIIQASTDPALPEAVYRATRDWTWPIVGKTIREVFLSCHQASS